MKTKSICGVVELFFITVISLLTIFKSECGLPKGTVQLTEEEWLIIKQLQEQSKLRAQRNLRPQLVGPPVLVMVHDTLQDAAKKADEPKIAMGYEAKRYWCYTLVGMVLCCCRKQ